jgi:hypothetical protein
MSQLLATGRVSVVMRQIVRTGRHNRNRVSTTTETGNAIQFRRVGVGQATLVLCSGLSRLPTFCRMTFSMFHRTRLRCDPRPGDTAFDRRRSLTAGEVAADNRNRAGQRTLSRGWPVLSLRPMGRCVHLNHVEAV